MQPLVVLTRSNQVESLHQGYVCVASSEGQVRYSLGDLQTKIFLRSSAKPLIAVALVESGALEKFEISPRELAVICSSHSGQDFHRQAVSSILKKIGLDEQFLLCGRANPYNRQMNEKLIKRGERPSPLYNCCSGKHAGMLALCRYFGYPVERYTDPEHPVQQLILKTIGDLLDCDSSEICTGTDGCGAPNFQLSMQQAAYLFAQLAQGGKGQQKHSGSLGLIKRAMTSFPRMVNGDGEFCTDLIKQSGGRVIGKVGGEGVYCAAVLDQQLGIAVKIADGNERAAYPVMVQILNQLGVFSQAELDGLRLWACPPLKNHHGKVIGYTLPVFDLGQGARAGAKIGHPYELRNVPEGDVFN
ncbi:MAG: asparaginase [Bacillota bacterium]